MDAEDRKAALSSFNPDEIDVGTETGTQLVITEEKLVASQFPSPEEEKRGQSATRATHCHDGCARAFGLSTRARHWTP
jgi:hypothetical protein